MPTIERRTDHALRRALSLSTAEGMAAEVVGACSVGSGFAAGAVLAGWALHLGCGPLWLGLLGALPFFAHLAQLPAALVTSAFGRRRVAIAAVAASRQVFWPLVVLPWLPLSQGGARALLLAVAAASSLLAVVGNNAWTAWMGDLVPARVRGRYFGARTSLCTLAGTAAALAAGLALDAAGPATGRVLSALALVACVAGAATTWLMALQARSTARPAEPRLALGAALQPLRDPRARRVLLFLVAWNGAVGLSGSFFQVHLLQNLRLGYARVALHATAAAVARMAAAPLFGRAVDRAGARPVLAACSFGLAATPLLWIGASAELPWPIALDALVSGALLGGHALASFALPLETAPREGRPFYLAAFATAGGLAYALASSAGGALLLALPRALEPLSRPGGNLHLLFGLGALGRLGAAALAVKLQEAPVGAVQPTS
ncbi:MFS transporter [Anaeromyxobacter paludicola]|uniref:MFS transporter n=1 Tax=Anaeromyxobacter paludicola TaxID=2918171 RepID=A0ABM7XA84_9BACT|nr:MFS transporter [Anaeromyxobacter paludicola]BDG08759.1 MFS transporter [Anaeromyxobacter paludicola]